MKGTPKTVEQVVRSHSINVLRECAVQTHTDWERYVSKSEKTAKTEVEQLLKEARADELKLLYVWDEYLADHAPGLHAHLNDRIDELTGVESLKEGEE